MHFPFPKVWGQLDWVGTVCGGLGFGGLVPSPSHFNWLASRPFSSSVPLPDIPSRPSPKRGQDPGKRPFLSRANPVPHGGGWQFSLGTLTDLGGTTDQPAHHLPPPPGHGIQGHPHHLQDRRQERRGSPKTLHGPIEGASGILRGPGRLETQGLYQ